MYTNVHSNIFDVLCFCEILEHICNFIQKESEADVKIESIVEDLTEICVYILFVFYLCT